MAYMFIWIHTVHPESYLLYKDLHEQDFFG